MGTYALRRFVSGQTKDHETFQGVAHKLVNDADDRHPFILEPNNKRGYFLHSFRRSQDYQLVLEGYTKSLEEFKDVKELLTAFYDGIHGKWVRFEFAFGAQ